MHRRDLLKSAGAALAGAALSSLTFDPLQADAEPGSSATHVISLSFDDGFAKSFRKVAEIHEQHGVSACFNVIASGHLPEFEGAGDYILPELMGNFELWNELQERGHEVMPHGWKHADKRAVGHEEATALITRCLDYFSEHLRDFDPRQAVFNFPYNSSTPELNEWTLTKVRAVRTRVGNGITNPHPAKSGNLLTCISKGPENIDQWVSETIEQFLDQPGGWLILNTHGLDGEGWGPMSSKALHETLEKLTARENVDVIPVGKALQKYASQPS